jgi:adenylate cyclase
VARVDTGARHATPVVLGSATTGRVPRRPGPYAQPRAVGRSTRSPTGSHGDAETVAALLDAHLMDPHAYGALAESLIGKPELTALDVARDSGVEPDDLRRFWQALGFPPVADDVRSFTRTDVQVVRAVRDLVEAQHADPSDVLQLTRVIGHAMARIGDAQITAIAARLDARQAGERTGGVPLEELTTRIRSLAPALEGFLGYVWRRHLVAAALQLSAVPSATDRTLIVGFADMVRFTAMSRALETRALAAVIERFESIACAHVVEHGGRIVKTIGDEVMFCVDEPGRAAEIALALVEAHARDADLPEVRVGVASGPTLAWQGDLFGPTVNLASRLVDFANRGTVVVSEELGAELGDRPGFELRHLRPVKLRGIGRVRSWVVRRAG